MGAYWCLLVLVLCCCGVQGAIWSSEKRWQQEASPQEIRVDDSTLYGPGQTASQQQEATRIFKRQASNNRTNIGFTAPLTGDNHPHGLVHWTGYPSEVLFVLTRNRVNGLSGQSWLWRSTDYGHNFTNDTVKWDTNTVINWYYISSLTEYLIFADITNRMLWVTRDEGDSYVRYSVPFDPNRITFQSRRAPGSNSSILAQYVLGYDSTLDQLWVSTNLGSAWTRLRSNAQGGNVTRYSWRVLDSTLEDNTTVYYEETMNATHSRLWTSTFPYTASQLFPGLPPFLTNSFVLSNEYMFVQMNTTSTNQYNSPLWVSRNRAAFRQARFPLRAQERHYSVVDTSEGQVFIGVYHDINNTNLYLSEVAGVDYSLSLTSVVSPPESDWIQGVPEFDLHVVEGLVGTFIANTRQPSQRFGSTVISYDKGGNWAKLRPPTLDLTGVFIDCQQPNCSLHLHIQATRDTGYQSILTQDSAIGLIMAAGNLGSSLNPDTTQMHQYFSRDGGFTWLEVDSGFKQFQFSAQGAIVTSVTVFQRTSSAKWSCDEGASWEEVAFQEEGLAGVRVIGMLTEPGERAARVTIFGIGIRFVEWLVIDLNFETVVPNQCTSQDFFTWIPTDDRPGSRCLLGESITYERRRSDRCCSVDPSYNRPISRTVCTCALEDFECDFGFERIFLNSPCTPMEGFVWPPPQPSDCQEGHNYTFTSGYRKVAGDKCVRGEELSYFPNVRQCIVGAPQIISLRINSVLIAPRTNITFILTQVEGGKIGTTYHWDYNDTHHTTLTGYDLGHQQQHSFAFPGVYNVSVLASNGQGSSFFSLAVTVVDPVASVRILPPSRLTSRNELPVDTQQVFSSSVSTRYNTTLTGPLQYVWGFEGNSSQVNTATVTHIFTNPITYTVTLSVITNAVNVIQSEPLTVIILDRLSDVDIILPRPLIKAGVEAAFASTHTTEHRTVKTGQITYHWNWGDGGTNASIGASSSSHTFLAPGNYTVRLTANNNFSRATVSTVVNVLDPVTGVEVSPPIHTIGGEIPATIPLLFSAGISTQYNTTFTGRLQYSWDFGDGTHTSPASATITHTYTSNGTFTVTCSVQGPEDTDVVQGSLVVVVFEASDSQSVEIRSSQLIDQSQYFVKTRQPLIWRVESIKGSGHVIPPDTNFKWTVVPSRSDVLDDSTGASCAHVFMEEGLSPQYNLTLTCWGRYQVTVIGNYSAGSFVSWLQFTAEAVITDVVLADVPPVLRAGGVTNLTLISSTQDSSTAYEGPITLFIKDTKGSALASPTLDFATRGSNSMMVQLERDEASTAEKGLTLQAYNDISSINRSASVILAVHGQYEELRFIFLTSLLPSDYKSSSFRRALQEELKSAVYTNYLADFHNILVEVEGSGVMNSTNSTSELTVRSVQNEVLYVDLNILPETLQPEDIQAIKDVSPKIQAAVDSGTFSLQVQGSRIAVGSVDERGADAVIVVEPDSKQSTLYIGLGAGLGTGLVLILVVAVILGVAVYFYRKNYKRLNVRYARLRQTPVRFTFTQGGEMVEDEDYDPPSDDGEGEEEEEVHVQNHGARGRGGKVDIM